jgi:hypothetical protein
MSNPVTESAAAQALREKPQEIEQAALARLLFEHIENQIKAADWKAWTTIALNTFLATVSATLISKPLEKILTAAQPGGVPVSGALVGSVITTIGIFGAILFSLWFAIKVLKPELMASNSNNLFFFGNIARLREPAFIEKFNNQTREMISSFLLGEIHAKAIIAERKFSLVNRSLEAFFVALFFGALSQLLVLGGGLHIVFSRGS